MDFNRFILIAVLQYSLVSALPNIVEQLAANGATTLLDLIDLAGLTDTLKTSGPYTIIAPTNAAFQRVPKEDLTNLQSDIASLKDVLQFHIINGEIFSFDLKTGELYNGLNGHFVRVRMRNGHCYFNEAIVEKADIQASNGVIYLVDEVLDVPEGTIWEILNNPDYQLSIFANITETAQTVSRLNTTGLSRHYTVFVPSDAAFHKLPADTLAYILSNREYAKNVSDYHIHGGITHVSDMNHMMTSHLYRIRTMFPNHNIWLRPDPSTGEPLLNRLSHVVIQDIPAENGVVQVISDVLFPSSDTNSVIVG